MQTAMAGTRRNSSGRSFVGSRMGIMRPGWRDGGVRQAGRVVGVVGLLRSNEVWVMGEEGGEARAEEREGGGVGRGGGLRDL